MTASSWTRVDNALSYVTPTVAGFTGYAMYSFKNDSSKGGVEGHGGESDRYASLAARYKAGALEAVLVADTTMYGTYRTDTAASKDDGWTVTFGGNYTFDGGVRLLAFTQFFGDQELPAFRGVKIVTSQRSAILSSRKDMSEMIRSAFMLGGAEVTTGEGYPGWKPNPSSPILKVAVDSYKKLFGVEPKVKAIHAGLECGLFLEKYPSLDMVSFGPTLRGVHSPDERMLIPTVDKFWRHLLDVLVHVPEK